MRAADILPTVDKISEEFLAVAVKTLSKVDIPRRGGSNQHEIGGLVKAGIGKYLTKQSLETFNSKFPTTYISLNDGVEPKVLTSSATWYDPRAQDINRSSEYRLYYPHNEVVNDYQEGDFLLVALNKQFELLIIRAAKDSQSESLVRTAFGLEALTASAHFINAHIENKQ